MEQMMRSLGFFLITVAMLLFFFPIVVIIAIVGFVRIQGITIDLRESTLFARVALALVGMLVWMSVYSLIIMLIISHPNAPAGVLSKMQGLPSPVPSHTQVPRGTTPFTTASAITSFRKPIATLTPTVIPKPTSTLTPTSTTTPSPPPTPVPSLTPVLSPEQAVIDYYTLINQRQYDLAWSRLSDNFKRKHNCCTPQGDYDFVGYVRWWESVVTVKIKGVALVETSGNYAVVYTVLRYLKKDGKWYGDPRPYIYLILDDKTREWLFDDKRSSYP